MSVDRTENSLRLELGTERQKRQLAEERLRQIEERASLNQSSHSLLSAALAERQLVTEECDLLRTALDELRTDNETLANMVEQMQRALQSSKDDSAKWMATAEAQTLAVRKLTTELQDNRARHERLEDRHASDIKKLSLMSNELGEKDTALSGMEKSMKLMQTELVRAEQRNKDLELDLARHGHEMQDAMQTIVGKDATLGELQQHFKLITDKLRALNEDHSVLQGHNRALQSEADDQLNKLHQRRAAHDMAVLNHQETARRLSLMLMFEDAWKSTLYAALTQCTTVTIPTLEQISDAAEHECAELRVRLQDAHVDMERLALESQLRRGLPKSCQTDILVQELDEAEREHHNTIEALKRARTAQLQAEEESRELRHEVEARREALARVHVRRKTPLLPNQHHDVRRENDASDASSPIEGSSPHADVSIETLFQRGEALVLKQRMESMIQKLSTDSSKLEELTRENEQLKRDAQSANEERLRRQPAPINASITPNNSFVKTPKNQRVEALEQRLDEAKSRVEELESERDRTVRELQDCKRQVASYKLDVASYRRSLEELQQHVQELESNRVPQNLHSQEVQRAQTAAADAEARCEAAQKHLSLERIRRMELEEEVASLRTLQSLSQLQDETKRLTEEKKALMQCVDNVQWNVSQHFEAQLHERDRMIADAAKKLLEASDEIDSLEYERQSLRKESATLRGRIDAMLTLQERTGRLVVPI